MNKKYVNGFTIIELLFVIAILVAAGFIFLIQKNQIETVASDDKQKTAINAMYYSLEKVFYPENGYYPQTINSDVLRSVDPDLFTDQDGIAMNDNGSSLTYVPADCQDNKCKKYTLRAILINEADYVKTNAQN